MFWKRNVDYQKEQRETNKNYIHKITSRLQIAKLKTKHRKLNGSKAQNIDCCYIYKSIYTSMVKQVLSIVRHLLVFGRYPILLSTVSLTNLTDVSDFSQSLEVRRQHRTLHFTVPAAHLNRRYS
jgi:hypothetical protein